MKIYDEGEQLTIFDPAICAGKMFREFSHREPQRERTSELSSKKSSELKTVPYLYLDLTPGHGNLLGESYWELIFPCAGGSSILNTGPAPLNAENVYTLSQILEENPPTKYYLSKQACWGILRRAAERDKPLPEKLKQALEIQTGCLIPSEYIGNLCNEGIDGYNGDLTGEVSATLGVNCGMSTGRNGVIDMGTNTSDILCLNDQGRSGMECNKNVTGTLQEQKYGHQPRVYENHGLASRCTGPHAVAPTMSARYGTGGNNIPIVEQEPVYCIVGNVIDRQPQNGGNGFGYQTDVSYTLTAVDHHAVFSRQRVDLFKDDAVCSTQSARQHKDATDLVMDVAGLDCRNARENGDLCGTLQKGTSGSSLNSIHPIRDGLLIRRLTPLECERLQGFPDGWTNIPGASDSARYKALGNSVAIPCVEYVMRGLALALKAG